MARHSPPNPPGPAREHRRGHVLIDEGLVRELLDATEDDAVLVLVEGRAQVVGPSDREDDRFRGAAVLMSRAELVDRLGTSSPTQEEAARLASSLRDAVGKLGA